MKKYLFGSLIFMLLFSTVSIAQQSDNATTQPPGNERLKLRKVFKPDNPTVDKTDVIDITGMKGATFTVSNKADGSEYSYDQSLRIVLGLQPANNKSGDFQVVFYSPAEKIPYAVTQEGGMTTIYYPVATYEGVRQNLEQALAARKKVQLKIIQKTDGYREGSLIF